MREEIKSVEDLKERLKKDDALIEELLTMIVVDGLYLEYRAEDDSEENGALAEVIRRIVHRRLRRLLDIDLVREILSTHYECSEEDLCSVHGERFDGLGSNPKCPQCMEDSTEEILRAMRNDDNLMANILRHFLFDGMIVLNNAEEDGSGHVEWLTDTLEAWLDERHYEPDVRERLLEIALEGSFRI